MLHLRGDITGMFLFFLLMFIGLWQIVVAWKKLDGLSITGYHDRRGLSAVIGVAILVGSCGWYFSRPGHFASPDVEGIETLILLTCALIAATALQVSLSYILWHRRRTMSPPT